MKALTTTELVQAVLKYNKPLNLVSPNPAQESPGSGCYRQQIQQQHRQM